MIAKKMKSAILMDKEKIVLEDAPVPEPSIDEVLIKMKSVGICGSDIHFYVDGRIGYHIAKPPFILGHEGSGEIVKVGSSVKDLKIGDRVTMEPGLPCGKCNYCMSGRYNLCYNMIFRSDPPIQGILSEYVVHKANFCFKFSDSVSYDEAALAEPLSVAVYAALRAEANPGKKAAILGAGPIGQMCLQVLKIFGVGEIIISDIEDYRLDIANNFGALYVVNSKKENIKDIILKNFKEGSDITFETAGTFETISDSIYITRKGGTVIQIANPPEAIIPYPLLMVLDKELKILGSYRYANCYPTVINILSSNKLNIKKLISHRFPFEKTDEAFKFAHYKKSESLKIVVYFG